MRDLRQGACKNPKYYLWVHCGGYVAVTKAEGVRLNADPKTAGGDPGGYPIGADCLKKHPELRPYVEE